MAKKYVYLIRHGQTRGNAEKRFIGRRTDDPLSEEGKLAAQDEKQRWTEALSKGPLRVCVSPMQRAKQTAHILFADAEAAQIEELSEMDFGIFEGKNHQELDGNEVYQKWIDQGGMEPIPEGEGLVLFQKRSWKGFCKALGDPKSEEQVAIVCHGGTIMAVMSKLTGQVYYTFMTENLGGYRLELELDDEGIHLLTYHRLGPGDPA
ncbi:MAG: histidine phosphatase family protein [Lachnospiraceae bacterium]|nr:histidine phosphatase family protein [Lachnospiraceae bacterium]